MKSFETFERKDIHEIVEKRVNVLMKGFEKELKQLRERIADLEKIKQKGREPIFYD